MKLTLVTIAVLLSGCGAPVVCVEGVLWHNVNPLSYGHIYNKSSVACLEVK